MIDLLFLLIYILITKFNIDSDYFLKSKDDDSVLPSTLNGIIGKTLLFKMGVTSNNLKSRKATFIVDIVTDDEVIIDQFLTQNLSKVYSYSYYKWVYCFTVIILEH